MALTPRIRFQVLQRDGFACVYCGARAPQAKLHVDHIVPRSQGGSDALENLQAACRLCNAGKAAHHIPGIDGEDEPEDPMELLTLAVYHLLGSVARLHDEPDFFVQNERAWWVAGANMHFAWSVLRDFGVLPHGTESPDALRGIAKRLGRLDDLDE